MAKWQSPVSGQEGLVTALGILEARLTPGACLTSLSKMKAGGPRAGPGVRAWPAPQGVSPPEEPHSADLEPLCSFYLKFTLFT